MLAVLLNDNLMLAAGSRQEGTNITPNDYHISILQSVSSSCFSDGNYKNVCYHIRVVEEGEA